MKYISLLSCLLIVVSCAPEVAVKEESIILAGESGSRLDSLLTPYIVGLREQTDNKAGLVVGISKGNQTVYARSFGYADAEKKIPVNFKTKFHIASLSKPFVAAAILKLVDIGALRLEDKIKRHIPEFVMAGQGYENISIRNILTHTSGIPANIKTADWTDPSFGPGALEENLDLLRDIQLEFEPGSQYSYSNSAYDLLGLLIERVSGMRFSEFVTKEILVPAGMSESVYTKPKDTLPEDWALSYSYGLQTQPWTPYPYNERLFPSSGLVTNLEDMMLWATLNLAHGEINGIEVLGKDHYEKMLSPQFATPWGDNIGLSWFLQSYLDRPVIMHQGQDTGFEAIIYLYPKDSVSIVVMANRDYSRTGRIINAASEILFADDLKTYSVSAKYPFSKTYREGGIEAARLKWAELRADTTDNYYVDDDDILSTGAILENAAYWNETREVLEFYKDLNDQSTYAWRLLGNAYLHLGDTLQAIAHYEKCLEINPEYEKAKAALAPFR
ncbi:CubicO group peptidase, beta-lactamase class C family [Robiginitalea myxolifaciens]|uniref:CubicO group peptidase, beta-lactamase class C family n=1 Tax=Robiginitalea myxolifaciens TaxID=400055 RepID=A0A1I6HCL5_9FLAO|nr:serine hydrolase [Robiginitalea myxolifaciens]SFR52037.1 CubicO group peptidase, beta-lactamase class C family [Robiginitalea myxolifaciens]